MKQLVVNADDFGVTKLTSQGILDAHHRGIVTSTSLMANGEAFDAAVEMSNRAPRLSIGAHLVLTQAIPVSPASEIPTLVDSHGRLWSTPREFLQKLAAQRIRLREAEVELSRQIVRIRQAGVSPTHLDGHQHLHVLPGISDIVIRLALQFSIPCVRCPEEALPPAYLLRCLGKPTAGIFKQYLAARVVSGLARRFRSKLAESGLNSPDSFCGLSQTGFLNVEALKTILHNLPDGTSELMCHPGYADSLLAKTGTRLIAQRETECRALMSPEIIRIGESEGIQLMSYGEFARLGRQREKVAAQDLAVGTAGGYDRRV
jgi:predicted glycoside hydrolase/deacetylase ChbG (UPF0249 family)